MDWTKQNAGTGFTNFYTVTYGNGLYAVAGFPGTYIRTSLDGVTWSNHPAGYNVSISGLGYGNGTFIAAADDGALVISTNGVVWNKQASKATSDLWAVAYGASTFVIAGYSGTILQSDDLSIPWLSGQTAPGGFQLSLTGEIGRAYRVQTTTNFLTPEWSDLFSVVNDAWTTNLLDAAATNFPQRFYRAVTP
jgi:hypothetical protein